MATGTTTAPVSTAVSAGARLHPPALFMGFLMAGFLLQRLFPFKILPGGIARSAGLTLAVSGFALMMRAVRTMRAAGTPVEPYRPSTTLVTTGPYQYTRNPIYIGMTLLYAGLSTLVNAVWPLLLLPSALFLVTKGMVEKEEQYLEQRFGDRYRQYKEHVRRWL